MRGALKTGVVLAPFLAVFLLIRACAQDEAARWRDRVAEVDPLARVVVDDDDLILIGPEEDAGRLAADEVRRFKDALVTRYGDLLGRGREQRMVVVLFSSGDYVRKYAGQGMPFDTDWVEQLHGYTDARQGAMFIPPETSPNTLRHETVHWVVATTSGGLVQHSPWLNEGLAQLFERYTPGETEPGVGAEDRRRVRMLVQADTIDVERLLAMEDYREFVVANGARNYLEALVLTSFLYERRERDQLKRYIDAERAGPGGRVLAFERIYDHRGAGFRSDLRDYVRDLKSG